MNIFKLFFYIFLKQISWKVFSKTHQITLLKIKAHSNIGMIIPSATIFYSCLYVYSQGSVKYTYCFHIVL